MSYNAINDAMKLRVVRKSIKGAIGVIPPDKLLILLIDLIDPSLTKPILAALRDSLAGKTDEQLDALIAELG